MHAFKIINGMLKKDSWKCMHRVQKFRRMGKKDSWKTLYLTFYLRWNSFGSFLAEFTHLNDDMIIQQLIPMRLLKSKKKLTQKY